MWNNLHFSNSWISLYRTIVNMILKEKKHSGIWNKKKINQHAWNIVPDPFNFQSVLHWDHKKHLRHLWLTTHTNTYQIDVSENVLYF